MFEVLDSHHKNTIPPILQCLETIWRQKNHPNIGLRQFTSLCMDFVLMYCFPGWSTIFPIMWSWLAKIWWWRTSSVTARSWIKKDQLWQTKMKMADMFILVRVLRRKTCVESFCRLQGVISHRHSRVAKRNGHGTFPWIIHEIRSSRWVRSKSRFGGTGRLHCTWHSVYTFSPFLHNPVLQTGLSLT